ncbi:DUF3173 family protein [Candidatus Enterococcus courvalinii]|uniref:DUF3173 family protein n=1 Tax=Candidatus Enterococcus courvalinii TaxID=2815329 RepID=A0ABS3I217_9ENTE|nr:DUF3173 family protein [Enterococcus sp. MSG2901]MBO0482217.1 DUF3173 family protein [Enterococcus sp. MSG2901]
MYKQVITKHDLEKIGFTSYQAQNLIRQAKQNMVKSGYDIYENRKIISVPTIAIKSLIGFEPRIPEGDDLNGN